MGIVDILLIGMALSVDACAITIANCTAYKEKLNRKLEWAMPIVFGLLQGIMPLIGYYIGSTFAQSVGAYSGYISAAVFLGLAIKIVWDIVADNLKEKKAKEGSLQERKEKQKNVNFWVILLQGIATSIDALIIGVTFSMELTFSIFWAIAIIIGITFILVTISLVFGKYLGKIIGKFAPYVGAILLFALFVKSLVEAIIG